MIMNSGPRTAVGMKCMGRQCPDSEIRVQVNIKGSTNFRIERPLATQ